MKKLFFTGFLFVVSFFPTTFIHAQTLQSLSSNSDAVIVTLSSDHPSPGIQVTATAETYALDINRATIEWVLNGKATQTATNQKTFTFNVGKAGSVSTLLVIIRSADGITLQKLLTIRPASVNLLWEGQSYTPPFYKGKALFSYEGRIKVVAIPSLIGANGTPIDQKKLIYTWHVNGNNAGSASGIGKNYIYFNAELPIRPVTIDVDVASVDQTYVASGSMTIAPQAPFALFYEHDPVLGTLYNKVLQNTITLKNEELQIITEPFGLGATDKESSQIKYEWTLNGNPIAINKNPSTLTFRQEKGTTGTAEITLQINTANKIFQTIQSNFSIRFGSSQTTSLF